LSKFMIGTILLLSLLLLGSVNVRAQGVSPYFGLGSAVNKAGTTVSASVTCPPGQLFDSITNNCEPGPTMGGVFGIFGVDFMFRPHLGVNGEYAFRFAQANYLPLAGLKFRPAFYDFNVVWEPISGTRIVPVLEGGIGGARVALYVSQTTTITGISGTFSYPAGLNANHFQGHAAVGLKLYVRPSLFIKPQFDFHYVTHLTDQFGRDWVPQYTVSVGYTFGER
jgi:hypothetical protein